jgi:hypothetical protein
VGGGEGEEVVQMKQIDTPEFKRWFGNSKVVDAKGLPLVVYHGSPDVSQLTAFSKETLGMTTGSKSATRGFFFVDKHSVASQYAGMMNESQRVAAEKLDAQIERLDAARYDARTPEEYQKAEARYQSAVAKQMPLVPEASRAGVHWTDMFGREHQMRYGQGSGVLAVYLSLKNPMIVEQQNASFRDQTYDDLLKEAKRKRHDGLIIRNTDDAPFGGVAPQTIYVAFRPEQIKSAYGNRGTFDRRDPDITNPKRSTKSGKPSLETGERYLPAAAIGSLSSAEYAASTRAKRSATGQFSRQPKRIAMKTREFRNPVTYPPEDITLSHESTPANDDIAANRKLWGTPAFKKWFGDSKVRDLAKRPMVVYHGTCASGFTKFDPTKTREMGFHFGTPPQAKDFLKGCSTWRGKRAGIYPVYLSIQKPLFTPDVYSDDPTYFIGWLEKTNHIHDWFPDESDSYYKSMNRLRDQMVTIIADSTLDASVQYTMLAPLRKKTWGLLRKIVMRKGYDGIRYKNENEGNTDDPSNIAWIAFSPAQVKSATENRGTFDRRDPDITNPKRSMVRSKLSRIIEPGDRILCYDTARGEDFYRLWDIIHTAMPLTKEALVEVEGMLDDDGVFVIESGEEPPGLRDHFRKATRYQGLLLVQGPMNPEEARINTEKLRRELE